MEPSIGNAGVLRVVTPQQLDEAEALANAANIQVEEEDSVFRSEIAAFVRRAFEDARNWRDTEQIRQRNLQALRAYRGTYDAKTLQQIEAFSGSAVYSRLTEAKCRGASALLRDIYLQSSDRPWDLAPTPVPEVPEDVQDNIAQLVQIEMAALAATGQPIDPDMIRDRMAALQASAEKATVKKAKDEAERSTRELNDLLVEGGFYQALREFLIDLPIFLFGCIKGPIIQQRNSMSWQNGESVATEEYKLCWKRVSPFDLYFSPAADSLHNSAIMERLRFSRDELFDMIDLPGFDEDSIRRVLDGVDGSISGYGEWLSYFETERANLEDRESPNEDPEGRFIDCIEYNGYVKGQWLIDWGLSEKDVKDADKEYYVSAWLINREIIKVQLSPNPRKRPTYYVTSYEKVPGSIYGFGLPEILQDTQQVMNATLRALVNNLSIASGPQVVVNDDVLAPGMDGDSLYPWKRWHVTSDPYANNQAPITFYQPDSRANELLVVFEKFSQMADEVSGLPRYMTGSQRTGGAASTASGLSMLMNNASKVMQQVAHNIDSEVMQPALENLYDMVQMFYPEKVRGDESVRVLGVTTAMQQEQDRVRQLEFMQLTANPIDMQIIGPDGRAKVLKSVSQGLGLDHEDIVPDDEEMKARAQAAMAAQGGIDQPGPNASRSDNSPPRLDTVSNSGTQS